MVEAADAAGVLRETQERMDKAVQFLTDELRGVRTGRAHPGLVESIKVEYYGSPTPLNGMASISVPEPRMIVIKPFDAGTISDIEKAIQKSELGISPNNDGKVIRLSIPMLSEERRKQLASRVKELAEESRVTLRNIRRDANKRADVLKKDSALTEDDMEKLKGQVQDKTKAYEKQIDEIVEKKTSEIMEF